MKSDHKAPSSYSTLVENFQWKIPENCNIASMACESWATRFPDQVAIIEWQDKGRSQSTSYRQLSRQSNRFANALVEANIAPQDRVALLLPQCAETAIAHLGIYKLSAIAVPIALLFGIDALEYRLQFAGVKAIITNKDGLRKLRQIQHNLPKLERIFCIDDCPENNVLNFNACLRAASDEFTIAETAPDTPALMIFTSGTTGQPKGALHGHRVLAGHLPGIRMHHEFLPQPGDCLWTPADWAWAGGLLDVLLPGLALGVPVVGSRMQKFDPERAFALIADANVRNVFIPPTALKLMKAIANPSGRYQFKLRTIGSGGESLGQETWEWAKEHLGVEINEFYGQTECNLVLGSCGKIGVMRAGAIGKPVPGHEVAIINGHGMECATNEPGQIAVKRPDPVMFLKYWDNDAATRGKFIGDWMLTGDQGYCDDDGYFYFIGRDDDIITSSGYRIGPGEIEDCLLGHPAVSLAAVVGKPDDLRTEIIKAYIVLKENIPPSAALKDEIRNHVRNRLSAHEYPREIAFVDTMPLTTTGKVIRRKLRELAIQETREQSLH